MSLINYIFCHFKVSCYVITLMGGVATNFNEIKNSLLTKVYGGCLCSITNNNNLLFIIFMKYQKNDIVNIIFQ